MKSLIIADSSGLISLSSDVDSNHAKAIRIVENLFTNFSSVIIPSDVFSETMNAVGKKMGHAQAILLARLVERNNTFLIVDTTVRIRSQAISLFSKQPESVSFTDCIVMATADSFSTKQIFGFDEVFKKNKYIRLGIDE